MPRARAGWIAAVLLIAMAFLGGPDLLNGGPHTTTTAASSAAERDQRADDEIDSPGSATERLMPSRRRDPGLPPAPQNNGGTAARSADTAADRASAWSGSGPDGLSRRHRIGCSPEILQVFRC